VSRVAGCDKDVGEGGVVVDQPVAGGCVGVPACQRLLALCHMSFESLQHPGTPWIKRKL
jgi:hypothetical protein